MLRRIAALHEVSFSDAAIELLAGGSLESSSQLTVPQLNHAVMQLGHADGTEESGRLTLSGYAVSCTTKLLAAATDSALDYRTLSRNTFR